MFAIIRTRTMASTNEEFKVKFDRTLKELEYKGWLKSTRKQNQIAAHIILNEFLEDCYKGLKGWNPVKKKVSEDYVDRDLCSQVWDLQSDMKVTQLSYSCSELVTVEKYREYIERLKPYIENAGWRTFTRMDFTLKFTRTVEEI